MKAFAADKVFGVGVPSSEVVYPGGDEALGAGRIDAKGAAQAQARATDKGAR